MGIPPISTLASFVFYISAVVTLIMSCMHGHCIWGGVIVAIVAACASLLEGLFWYIGAMISWLHGYMQAKLERDVEEMKRCKRELRDAMTSMCWLPFCCLLVCIAAVPLMIFLAVLEVMEVMSTTISLWLRIKIASR